MADHGVTGVFNLVVGPGRTSASGCCTTAPAARFRSRARRRSAAASPQVVAGAVRPHDPRTGRQQRDRRHRGRRPRPGGARDPLRRRRHGRPALHAHAPPHRRTSRSPSDLIERLVARLRAGAHRRSARAGTLMGPLVEPAGGRRDARGARAGEGRGRRRSSAAASGGRISAPHFVEPTIVRMPAQTRRSSSTRPSRRSST